jgi:3-phenylpropionate/trans-cinnamate dioxygenase ferredoxin reductase subunit
LTVNGERIPVRPGSTLVDAALAGRVVIPTDCCSGQCDTCRVRIVSGEVDEAGTRDMDTVLACQARVTGSAEIAFEAPLPAKQGRGEVLSVAPLARDIVEVRIGLDEPHPYRPGQYVKVRFPNCPSRDYSPTGPMSGGWDEGTMAFHIRLYPGGVVSGALNSRIRPGDRIWVDGPYGHAFHRRGASRLVLVGTGTGWAPLWSIAREARLREPQRPLSIVIGARDPRHLYMGDALAWLRRTGVEDITLASTGDVEAGSPVRRGRPTEFLPPLEPRDVVHVAGAPAMVEAVKEMARAAGAACYADPFTPSTQSFSLLERLRLAVQTGDETRLRPRGPAPAEARGSGRLDPIPAARPGMGSRQGRPGGILSRWLDKT